MIDIPDFPETPHPQRERGRIPAQVQRTDDNSGHPPLVFLHEADGSWTIHGLGAPGVRLSKVEMVALTEGHVYRCYLPLCGVLLPTSKLPPSTCPDDCEFDVLYCSECVRGAAQWTAEAQRAERASGDLP